MLLRLSTALLVLLVLAPCADAKRSGDRLLRILTPQPNAVAVAHPHVNVVVAFSATPGGATPDASTFRARLNGTDVTASFTPLAADEMPGVTGLRAMLDDSVLRIGASNRLRLRVRPFPTASAQHGRRVKGRARIRFTAEARSNQPPTAHADADSTLLLPGVPIHFDASASSDPELDPLTWTWDFGDGATGEGAVVEHTYASAASDVAARVTVSDGAADTVASVLLAAEPPIDPDRTKGLLKVRADGPLEFGGVAVGQHATRTLTITNADETSTSQLLVRASLSDGPFTIEPASLDLGPAATGAFTVRFAPEVAGHAHAAISLVASATNRAAVSLLTHGFGGTAPGSGPTLAARTAFYAGPHDTLPGVGVYGIRPDGSRFFASSTVSECVVPGGGLGDGDACLADADCSPFGGTCNAQSTALFDPQDLCGDPEGNLIVLSTDGTVTDPDPNALTERSSALLRLSLDAAGTPIEKRILAHVTGDTIELACDEQSLADRGRVYVAQYFDVDDDRCLRTERDALMSFRKDQGGSTVLTPRLDSIEGVDGCNDLEDSNAGLATAGTGNPIFVGFDSGAIWRYDDRAFVTDLPSIDALAVHPDGALMFATSTHSGSHTTVNLYKVSPSRVAAQPLSFGALAPCDSAALPDNGGRIFVASLAVAASATDPGTAVALVALHASTGARGDVLPPALAPQGALAFTVPSGAADTCTTAGLVSLEVLELLSF